MKDVSWSSVNTINDLIKNFVTIKLGDDRGKVKEHFNQLASGLQVVKNQLSSIEGIDRSGHTS